ncbi:hypothetical protein VB620_16460 [Nodularia harveyana UHCC-0300]|uniref:Outer membrane protein beta-barrel domain-containing protein n=1 Tax=Nodularia harveyana UHCC-0300 TaxID=2974287 RepID=A0ABU5UHE4_9CYAN|nr:hypothetical protein [Nodularia harveyana]MEA5582929.1 hypothetical protein [Nodularia harveyana UHCC-0300]
MFLIYKTLRQSTSFFYLPSLAALTVLASGFSAVAQTVDTQLATESPVNTTASDLQQIPHPHTQEVADLTPIPGTVVTSAASLIPESESTFPSSSTQVAQADIDFGRTTRGGRSYIGVAGNIGLGGGDSSLGDGNFAVMSKVGITDTISVRPAAVFGNNTTILVPVTYDFNLQSADPFAEPVLIAPYVGVGAALKTGDDSKTAVLISGGIDFPLNPKFTATAAVNAGFFSETDIGVMLGVGYNFSGF